LNGVLKLPLSPPEIGPLAINKDLAECAPLFVEKAWTVLREMARRGFPAIVREARRTEERQVYLWKMGREWDDGRGVVTHAATAMKGWHFFGLAVDICSAAHPDNDEKVPTAFWTALREVATECGLTSGDDWDRDGIPVEDDPDEHTADHQHVQWHCPGMHVTPSDHARELYQQGGLEAVWRELNAA
jgi:hypothetical protein